MPALAIVTLGLGLVGCKLYRRATGKRKPSAMPKLSRKVFSSNTSVQLRK